ncbi:MAG: hypothetical protein ABI960_07165 [Candidatus Eisenbacteria bacterium]
MTDSGRIDRRCALAGELESLDDTSRLVLALLYVERLTVVETAQALGLDVPQVDRAATSARARLAARVHDMDRRAA